MDNLFFLQAKCGHTHGTFYIRFDKAAGGTWCQTYGVKTVPQSASGSVNSRVSIDISEATTGPQYRCPYCGNESYVRCGQCKQLTCFNYGDRDFTCAHCGHIGTVTYDSFITDIEGNSGIGQS